MAESGSASDYPDGIGEQHLREPGLAGKVASWLPLPILGALMLIAMSGLLGGGRNQTTHASSPLVGLAFNAPHVLRSGQFFEMRLTVTARGAIARPVIAVPVAYWRDLTINSFYPAAAREESRGGRFEFELEPIAAGGRVQIKVDGQVNPPLVGTVGGRLELRDGERRLASMPVSLRVLP